MEPHLCARRVLGIIMFNWGGGGWARTLWKVICVNGIHSFLVIPRQQWQSGIRQARINPWPRLRPFFILRFLSTHFACLTHGVAQNHRYTTGRKLLCSVSMACSLHWDVLSAFWWECSAHFWGLLCIFLLNSDSDDSHCCNSLTAPEYERYRLWPQSLQVLGTRSDKVLRVLLVCW